jgi:hypothetical protein
VYCLIVVVFVVVVVVVVVIVVGLSHVISDISIISSLVETFPSTSGHFASGVF